MINRAGCFVTNLSGEQAYKSFKPVPLPPNPAIDINSDMLKKLIAANQQLAILESLSSDIPSLQLFISMYVRKEALMSSQIEGTQCTLDDLLDPFIDSNANKDVSDVVNYVKATEYAIERLKTFPLCSRLIKETHAVLLQGVRGQEKTPGEFRYSQNWIGGNGSTLQNARYVPPNPADMINAVSDLDVFINTNDLYDPLVNAALIHYQFETIHPFLDGNGRVGRLLITLYLIEKKVLSTPVLYISYYLKMNRIEYYDRMTAVRTTGDYEQWICFFLDALTESAKDAIATIRSLVELHNVNLKKIEDVPIRQKKTLSELFLYLEKTPIIETRRTSEALKQAYNTTAKSISILEEKGILVQTGKTGKARIYSYSDYLNILRKNTELLLQ